MPADLRPSLVLLAALAVPLLLYSRRALRRSRRARKVPRNAERVVILGASSGIGRAISHEYAKRGARVCIVARREKELHAVAQECITLSSEGLGQELDSNSKVCSVVADFTAVEDVVRLRSVLEKEWHGVDTVVVCAGVSQLRPVMDCANLTRKGLAFDPPQADAHNIQQVVDLAHKVTNVNFMGPIISAVSFIPLLQATSPAPSILLISSLAAIIPAPTRAFYAATKAASLTFYQALAIEHPAISFSFCIPATVKGEFRASAVDGVANMESNKGLEKEVVARRCVQAVDEGERVFFMPWLYSRFGHFLYWTIPAIAERSASAKYKFSS